MTMNDNLIEEGVEIRNGLIIKSIQKEDILELWQISMDLNLIYIGFLSTLPILRSQS